MNKKEPQPLFIGITGGNDIRRSMLESSKSILESMKDHEKLKSMRDEKVKKIHQFKSEVREISHLISELRSAIPKVQGLPAPKTAIERRVPEKIMKIEKKEKTDIERLEDELAEIENKLNSIA